MPTPFWACAARPPPRTSVAPTGRQLGRHTRTRGLAILQPLSAFGPQPLPTRFSVTHADARPTIGYIQRAHCAPLPPHAQPHLDASTAPRTFSPRQAPHQTKSEHSPSGQALSPSRLLARTRRDSRLSGPRRSGSSRPSARSATCANRFTQPDTPSPASESGSHLSAGVCNNEFAAALSPM